MQLPFLELHRDGLLKARVQINFLHMETDPALPGLKQRLLNQFQFFGDDMLMTGGIGEFVAAGRSARPGRRRRASSARPAGGPRCTR